MSGTTEPGWYPDPSGVAGQRWWDGTRWGDAVRPTPGDPAGEPGNRSGARWPWLVAGGLLLLAFGGALTAGLLLAGDASDIEVASDEPASAGEPEPEPEREPETAPDPEPEPAPEPEPTPESEPAPEPPLDSLTIGYLLPETGALALLGPPQIAAVNLAIEDVNAAGGVLGSLVTLEHGDEAGDGVIARQETARLIGAGVDAIVGAAASGMSQEVIDLTHDNQIVQCSASNTSPAFTDQHNNAFYFRTAPPDEAVAPLIAQTVIGDGYSNVAVLTRSDEYGLTLADLVVDELEGQVDVALRDQYDTLDPDFASLVTNVVDAGPDSVVIIGFDEAHELIRQLVEGGIDPATMYSGDGLFGPDLQDSVGVDITGLTLIGAAGNRDFNERLNGAMPDEERGNLIYGGQAYDCAIVIALAATAAGSTDPAAFNEEIEAVTVGGTECTSFEGCVDLLEAGEDIAYTGVTGPLNLARPDPTFGGYAIGEYEGGQLEIVGDANVDLANL